MSRLKKSINLNLNKLTEAFPYQKEAIDAVRDMEYSAIFFEQGLGKTKIAIDLTLDWLTEDIVDTVIVVTKKGLVRNWQQEFEIHSHIRPLVISDKRDKNHRALFSLARVFIANFEAVALEKEKIRAMSKHRRIGVILDESQKIKNPKSKLAQAFHCLSECFYKRVIMTGTPMANRPYDIWSQIYFLDKGVALGTDFTRFKAKLDIPKKDGREKFLAALSDVYPSIADFAVKQSKTGSGLDLPRKVYRTEFAEWASEQNKIYNKIKKELVVEIAREGKRFFDDTEAVLKRIIRLAQVASNPLVLNEEYSEEPGKLGLLRRLVGEIMQKGEKVIVWTSYLKNCSYLRNVFSAEGSVQVNGSMTIENRDRSVTRFKSDPDTRVMVATPQAAKEGLTLTVANHVIFYDRSFSLDDYLQAQDRIHRISQTRTCYVTNLVMRDSIDEWVEALLSVKTSAVRFGMGDIKESEINKKLEIDLRLILNKILNGES